MDIIHAGSALLFSEEPHTKPHLWFVLTDPDGTPPRVVAVMVRSKKEFTDDTVVLEEGDHPFVRHPSSVHYSTARIFRVRKIRLALNRGWCSLHRDMFRDLLKRVKQGLLDSAFTVPTIRDYCLKRF